jgi:hypothetical protein
MTPAELKKALHEAVEHILVTHADMDRIATECAVPHECWNKLELLIDSIPDAPEPLPEELKARAYRLFCHWWERSPSEPDEAVPKWEELGPAIQDDYISQARLVLADRKAAVEAACQKAIDQATRQHMAARKVHDEGVESDRAAMLKRVEEAASIAKRKLHSIHSDERDVHNAISSIVEAARGWPPCSICRERHPNDDRHPCE